MQGNILIKRPSKIFHLEGLQIASSHYMIKLRT